MALQGIQADREDALGMALEATDRGRHRSVCLPMPQLFFFLHVSILFARPAVSHVGAAAAGDKGGRTSLKPRPNGAIIPANQSLPPFSLRSFDEVGTRDLSVTLTKALAYRGVTSRAEPSASSSNHQFRAHTGHVTVERIRTDPLRTRRHRRGRYQLRPLVLPPAAAPSTLRTASVSGPDRRRSTPCCSECRPRPTERARSKVRMRLPKKRGLISLRNASAAAGPCALFD